ncbi:MAG: hypothetical protein OEY77_03315 [Nitrospira sp.]|nr:hypothetical protein [Nitrospira sp.]
MRKDHTSDIQTGLYYQYFPNHTHAMTLRNFNHIAPELGQRVYADVQAAVIGKVKLGDDSLSNCANK